jgi:hypothetical protein
MSGLTVEPRDLRLVFRNGIQLLDPLRLAQLFLEADWSYRSYDLVPTVPDDVLRREDIRVGNQIGARMSASEIDAVMERRGPIEAALKRIPGNASLEAPSEEVPWEGLHDLFEAVSGIPGVRLPKVTKALHKKRPYLIPLLDSVVAGYLHSVDHIPTHQFAEEGTALVRSYKVDLDANRATISFVRASLAENGYQLTGCRILDLYTWAYASPTIPNWARDARDLIVRASPPAAISANDGEESIRQAEALGHDLGLSLDANGEALRILQAAIGRVGYARSREEILRWLRT